LLFLILILLISCESDENITIEQAVNLNKIETVVNTTSKSEQRIAYRLLNSFEKYTLWINKLQNLTHKKRSIDNKFTSQQIVLLIQLKNDIKIEYFEENSDSKEFFQNIYIPNFMEKVIPLFTHDQIYQLFYSISYTEIIPTGQPGGFEDGLCECNVNSAWSCEWFQDNCEENDVCIEETGCGFFFGWICNGMCN